MTVGNYRRPGWLKISPFDFSTSAEVDNYMRNLELNTVCKSARCPNRSVCFSRRHVTFMILGDVCTRHCAFCAVDHGQPQRPDPLEPQHIGQAVQEMALKLAIMTSVTRDDLPEGGASQYAQTISEIKKLRSDTIVEILVPDFNGSISALEIAVNAGPDIIGHNVDTVPGLFPAIRPQADYQRSLGLLRAVKEIDSRIMVKSGIMLGLGESQNEVIDVMGDLKRAGCDILTVGQYLAPSLKHLEPARYAPVEEFEKYREAGLDMGFRFVYSAPLVRSSFYTSDVPLKK